MRTTAVLTLSAVSLIVLTGCAPGDDSAPEAAAAEYCQQQVSATFDDPSSTEFGEWEGGAASEAQRYEFSSTVSGDGQTFDLTCTVTGGPGSFLLESYNLTSAG